VIAVAPTNRLLLLVALLLLWLAVLSHFTKMVTWQMH
jgi:hypothetical protein